MSSNKHSPLVSILMSVYNGEEFLSKSLDSILGQTYQNWELILINDGSSDNSDMIIQNYTKECDKIRYFAFEKNQGLVSCLNFAIGQSDGKYLARMDADDEMMLNRLELQVSFMEKNEDVGILGSAVEFIDEESKKISTQFYPPFDEDIKKIIPRRNPISHPTVMIRKSILEESSTAYRDKYPRAEDYDLWLRLSKKTKMRNLEIPLLKYRYHSSQISQKKLKKMALDLIFLRLEAIKNNQIRFFNIIHVFKPFLYWISPDFIISRRLQYRKKRDLVKGEYIMK